MVSIKIQKTFDQLSYPELVKNGKASVIGLLSWPNSPFDFDSSQLQGNFSLTAKDGIVLEAKPGVARLFGLLTLQNLPRRLSLDFSDIFSKGFIFDRINAGVIVNKGILKSNRFSMEGPAAEVSIKGETNIIEETQNIHVVVNPRISDSLSLLSLAGGPLAGAAAFVAQKILKDNDILLIMDEVMTGFGRTGDRFGCETFNIEPDLMVAGKGMAGGYAAIAGVYGREEIADSISASDLQVMFHTFGALPQSCAAATCVLEILRRESLLEKCKSTGIKLLNRLQDQFSQHPLVAEVRGQGMLIGIEVVKDRDTLEPFARGEDITNKMMATAMEAGVFFYPGGTGEYRDILCIGAPYIVGETEIELMANALDKALADISPN